MKNIEKAKQYWSSGLGARIFRTFAGKRFSRLHEAAAEVLIAHGAQDALDIACGGGDFLLYLSGAAPRMHLAGTDVAPEMVKAASEKLAGKARVVESAAERQPFADHSFDAVTITMAFHHVEGKASLLKEAERLLKPGGVFVIADVIAVSNFQKKIWNIAERLTGIKGYIGHYTEEDLRLLARDGGWKCEIASVPDMAKRYKICKLYKQN